MPNSHDLAPLPPSTVRSYLHTTFTDSRVREVSFDPSYEPVILLTVGPVLAAFGFSNGDVNRSYSVLYSGFKNYYNQHRTALHQLDLAFVFCVRPDLAAMDEFCSTVETDVYFCRKFVVPLRSPVAASLARLPFLPLTEISGIALRPPSAQTFLQQCGVPPMLAKYLVVQRERSPERILEDCLSGVFGSAQPLTPRGDVSGTQYESAAPSVKLDSITIENFRAYRSPRSFTFGSDITLLYGPNGFGKTSLFDALDFAATGDIGRLALRSEDHFRRTAPHLDCDIEGSSVSMSVVQHGAVRKIRRSVADRRQALMDGVRQDRKAVLNQLTGGLFPAADRVENLVSLFRATHLFNQERPELTKEFRDDCRLPAEIVARMLAFEDYSSAISKAKRARDAAESAITEASAQIQTLTAAIRDEKREIERLNAIVSAGPSQATLEDDIRSVAERMRTLGLDVSEDSWDVAALRHWRANLTGRISASEARAGRLSELAKQAAEIQQVNKEWSELIAQIDSADSAHTVAQQLKSAVDHRVAAAEQESARAQAQIKKAESHLALLEWARLTKTAYDNLLSQQQAALSVSEGLQQEISVSNVRVEDNRLAVQSAEDRAVRDGERLNECRSRLRDLERLAADVATAITISVRLETISEEETATVRASDALQSALRELTEQSHALTVDKENLEGELRTAEGRHSRLQELVAEVREHLRGSQCPLCGQKYSSREDLIRRIDRQVAMDDFADLRTRLAHTRDSFRIVVEQRAAHLRQQKSFEQRIASIKQERAELEAILDRIKTAAARFGIGLGEDDLPSTRELTAETERIRQLIREAEAEYREVVASVARLKEASHKAELTLSTEIAELGKIRNELIRIDALLAELRADSRFSQVALEAPGKDWGALVSKAGEELRLATTHAQAASIALEQHRGEAISAAREVKAASAELSALRSRRATLNEKQTQFLARAKAENIGADADQQAVLRHVSTESILHTQLVSLRDSVTSLEMALDAATTAAALNQQLQSVRNKEKTAAASADIRQQYEPWAKYFGQATRFLEQQQSDAIESFTREYGPRTSVIQRRLRAVYGFDDVEILSRHSEITVRVKRRGEELRPTDYFSQSQQQTLLLGLFLTACISQTWSAFSTVLLDDPVTHFDDLNTYAFLDLLLGLLDPAPYGRQFVISTCDEKLLQLARQKFRHLGQRARFYKFTAIGEDGPTIDELPHSAT